MEKQHSTEYLEVIGRFGKVVDGLIDYVKEQATPMAEEVAEQMIERLDYSLLADEFSTGKIAAEIDLRDVARELDYDALSEEIGLRDLASEISLPDLAEECIALMPPPESIDYAKLAEAALPGNEWAKLIEARLVALETAKAMPDVEPVQECPETEPATITLCSADRQFICGALSAVHAGAIGWEVERMRRIYDVLSDGSARVVLE